jgi:hypothetical protein
LGRLDDQVKPDQATVPQRTVPGTIHLSARESRRTFMKPHPTSTIRPS